jgi:hypothetical protein
MKTIHLFIISWPGQHQKAVAIAESLVGLCEHISIIYSDEHEHAISSGSWTKIRRNEPSFWSDKFQTAMHSCASDIMLIIHADCMCSNWPELISKCSDAMQDSSISVYSPYILGSPWTLNRTRLSKESTGSLVDVAQVDALVFGLSKPIFLRMREIDYSKNVYGWGIDWFFVAASYAMGCRVVVDTSVRVMHKVGSGYSKHQAASEMMEFLQQMDKFEKIKYDELSQFILKNK